jgi:predicted nucleic acid-binding protein
VAILDASIVIAALSPDEALATAQEVIRPYITGGAHAPALWPFEIANTLYWKVRKGDLTQEVADIALNSAFLISITLDQRSPEEVKRSVVPLSWKHQLTSYDAAYLELALRLKLPIATIDKALIRAARAEGVTVL